MFKLKFFILFVLAGLCFGDPSASETVGDSSGKRDSSDTEKEEKDTETTNGQKPDDKDNEASDNQNDEAQTSEDQKNKEEKQLGVHLPSFIGSDEDKVSYMNQLLSACPKDSPYKINKENITFENCTFVCISDGATTSNKEERIPTGLLCNSGGKKCPDEGPCPKLQFPSC
ncbi:uncharacterized protein LOC8042074 isoform X2 [Ixodes scapularis]|uniref:uncharacterized protein LOC8042074 isoform X2 n=1 Tax=Ixodes scapularis TaxID=6945 RepID=UPI001A9D3C98|nr:uncharacterized protein LOC8042074 isoform X2 [Ixodes scapularis]